MRPEDLTAEIHHLDAVPKQRTGSDRLEKQARLMRLKAKLANRPSSELAKRLEGLDTTTCDCLHSDVLRATLDTRASADTPDLAFDRAVSTIESLVGMRH